MRLALLSVLLLVPLLRGEEPAAKKAGYPDLPQAVSSFGAAVADGYVYVYGGHSGTTHTYSTDTVVGTFHRLDPARPEKGWQALPGGPILQGLALVAHGGKLYRIGGMQPHNKPGEPTDNHSVADCAVFDPKTGKWAELPALPAGRSSHDAVVVGDTIVVAGGWRMAGKDGEREWHKTALVLDLSKQPLRWESLPQPFERRALSLAALDGKVYVVGGLTAANGAERGGDVLDLTKRTWSRLPELPAGRQNGFSPAACVVAGKLLVSPADGKVYRLGGKSDTWEEVAKLEKARLVHRLVPVANDRVLVLGGGSRTGNVAEVESIDPSRSVPPGE